MLRIHGNFTTELRFKAILASNTSSICTTTARQNAVALLRSDYLVPIDLMHVIHGRWQRGPSCGSEGGTIHNYSQFGYSWF